MDKKLIEEWVKDVEKSIDEHHSSLAVPMLGSIETPLCQICKNSDYHYGTWDEPECSAFPDNIMPDEYKYCMNYDCPKFVWNPDDDNNCFFDENHKPLSWDEIRKNDEKKNKN